MTAPSSGSAMAPAKHPQTMDDDTLRELRALQARAYGPDADIAQDPAAMRRLRELEERRRGRPAVASAAPAPALSVPEDRPSAPETVVAAERPAPQPAALPEPAVPVLPERADATDPADPLVRPRLSRSVRARWALSVVAAVAITAGVTYGLTKIAPVSTSQGAPQIATLEPVPGMSLPPGWMGAGPSSAVYEYYGLVLFESNGWGVGMGGQGDDCFTVVPSDQLPEPGTDALTSYSFTGRAFSACRVGSFPATIGLHINSEAPRELRDEHPDAALQFVKDGERIGVFLDAGGGD